MAVKGFVFYFDLNEPCLSFDLFVRRIGYFTAYQESGDDLSLQPPIEVHVIVWSSRSVHMTLI